jgi:anti-anti-sigma factor
MTFQYSEDSGFFVLVITGEVKVSSITELRKELQSLMNEPKPVAIDLSNVTYIDSSGISLLVNLQKKLVSQEKKFCLFGAKHEVMKVFNELNFDKIITIYADHKAFVDDNVVIAVDELYPPSDYDFKGKPYALKNLICPLCEHKDLKGFIVNRRTQEVKLQSGDLLPAWEGRDGFPTIDPHATQITVCPGCFFATRHVAYFNEESGEFKTLLGEKEIHSLVKDDSARARLLKGSGMSTLDKFYPPFMPKEAFWVYTIAEECAHTLYRIENRLSTYDLAFYNLALTLYCEEKQLPEYWRRAFMWYNEILRKKNEFAPATLVETLYSLYMLSEKLKRPREGDVIFAELKALNSPVPEYSLYLRAATLYRQT